MSNRMYGWSVMQDGGGLFLNVFATRQELIQHECWSLGEVVVEETRSLQPWTHTDSDQVSKAWRRIKRKYGLRAVRVVVMPAEEVS